jgi:hypothetical protein
MHPKRQETLRIFYEKFNNTWPHVAASADDVINAEKLIWFYELDIDEPEIEKDAQLAVCQFIFILIKHEACEVFLEEMNNYGKIKFNVCYNKRASRTLNIAVL